MMNRVTAIRRAAAENPGLGAPVGQKNLHQAAALFTSRVVVIDSSNPSSIVQLDGVAVISPSLESAGQQAFPGVKFVSCTQLDQVAKPGGALAGAGGILVMIHPESSVLARAREERDENGLLCWAVVALGAVSGADPTDAEVVPDANLNPSVLAMVLRSAWERHQLRRENARLRGNFMTFGSRIAHDLRTPIGGILTTAEMMREVLAEDAPQDVPLTQPILDSTEGLVKLIERVSFFARAIASREPAVPLDMGVPFWNAYQQLERSLLNAQIEFKHAANWPKVKGHESWLEVVWRILLGNAVQHSAAGSKVEAGWSDTDGGYRFWVRSADVPPTEKQATLFFPFHRLHEPGAPRGLGLPVMRSLVELEGGRCGFALPMTGGGEFYFELPMLR